MILFEWLNHWYSEHGPIKLPPLPLFDGKTLDELLPPDPYAEEHEGSGEGTFASGEPIPVEPDGGIGDGAKPLPSDPDPIPVEPDGGIGDGAGPIPDIFTNTVEGEGPGTEGNDHFLATDAAETFAFERGQGNDAISDFDLSQDTLDLSATEFTNVKDVIAASADAGTLDFVVATFKDLDEGLLMKTGDGAYAYMEGISVDDLESMTLVFAG